MRPEVINFCDVVAAVAYRIETLAAAVADWVEFDDGQFTYVERVAMSGIVGRISNAGVKLCDQLQRLNRHYDEPDRK